MPNNQTYNMVKYKYLGNNVGILHEFLYNYDRNYDDKKAIQQEIKVNAQTINTLVKNHPIPNLIAITADYYQTDSHKPLKNSGFRPVILFKSSHNIERENLTFWVKRDSKISNFEMDSEPAKQKPPANCSVGINYNYDTRLSIKTKKPKNKSFIKIRNMPIWYKIEEKYLVAPKKKEKEVIEVKKT